MNMMKTPHFCLIFQLIHFQLPKFKFTTTHLVVSTAQSPIAAHLKKNLVSWHFAYFPGLFLVVKTVSLQIA